MARRPAKADALLNTLFAAVLKHIDDGNTTVVALAQRCGVARVTIYDWIHARNRVPPLSALLIMADLVGYEIIIRRRS